MSIYFLSKSNQWLYIFIQVNKEILNISKDKEEFLYAKEK